MKPLYQLFLGAACLGFAPIFVKLITMGPTPIGIYRCGIAALILLAATLWRAPERESLKQERNGALWLYLSLAGFFFAVDLFVWHRSVLYAGAGLGTILANTQVFYVSAAGILFHKERLTLRFGSSVLLAFVGTLLLVSFRNPPAHADRYVEGVLYGLSTGVVYAGFVLSLRKSETLNRQVSSLLRLAILSAITSLLLVPVAIFEGSLRLPTASEAFWLTLLALVAQVAGWYFLSRNLKRVPVSYAGIVLIVQPLVATLLGAAWFAERLAPLQILGAAIVLAAIYLGTTRKPA